jgi:rhamnopyranosyl-N-acetylglucosaminyl-diphospho-decaprenol beta-1,3/1,4-galactofuranosyltransferase
VCAIVVTYNRQALLRECLAALAGQVPPVDQVLVVDNASTDGTRELLREAFPDLPVLALPRNVGGAGGFHAGMKWAYRQGFDWLWLMDDDGRPAPDCLARLLAHRRPNAALVPVQQDSSGHRYGIALWQRREVDVTADIVERGQPFSADFLFRFVGPLINRTVVEQVGLPNEAFFIWFDDLEYALRFHSKTTVEIIAVPDAIFFHDFGGQSREVRLLGRRSLRNRQPAWKLYYGARNHLYTLIRTRRNLREILVFFRGEIRFVIGEIVYEPDRWERVRMRLLGYRDGAIGRLGKRV